MSCDRDILLLISSYSDGEASPSEAARAEAHLAQCADCRKRLEAWHGNMQLLTWAYTRELPETLDADALLLNARKGEHQPMTRNTEHDTAQPRRIFGLPRWAWGGALAAVLLVALAVGVFFWKSMLPVGHELASGGTPRNARVGMFVSVQLGPHSKIRRVTKRRIQLERGWIAVNVQHGAGVEVLTPRMRVTDRGTRFHVGIGPKADYTSVEQGSVAVTAPHTRRTLKAGEALLTAPTGEITVLSLPPLRPGETDTGQPLRTYNPKFIPSTTLEIERVEGIKRLAARFPELQIKQNITSGSVGLCAEQEFSYATMELADLRKALRAHIAEIAQMTAGVKIADGAWSIPVALMQTVGFQGQIGLADDVYLLYLAPKDGGLCWQFVGSRGEQVEIPASLVVSEYGVDNCTLREDIKEVKTLPHHGFRSKHPFVLDMWPAPAKPVLTLTIDGPQQLAIFKSERALVSQLTRHFRKMPEIQFSTTDAWNVLNLDSRRQYRMLFAGNEHCGPRICRAFIQAQQGKRQAVIVGVLVSEMPLASPALAKGVYLVRLILPGGTQAPYLELMAPEHTDGESTYRLPSTIRSPSDMQKGNTKSIYSSPKYGQISLGWGVAPSVDRTFPIKINVTVDPYGTKVQKQLKLSQTDGWVRIKQP